jgi:hypothetical protein
MDDVVEPEEEEEEDTYLLLLCITLVPIPSHDTVEFEVL